MDGGLRPCGIVLLTRVRHESTLFSLVRMSSHCGLIALRVNLRGSAGVATGNTLISPLAQPIEASLHVAALLSSHSWSG